MTSHLKRLFDKSSQRGKPLSVLSLDIDYFKAVNDSYGYDPGNSVLREFAARVRRNIRGIDLACRLGGEARPSANHPWPLRGRASEKNRFPDFMWRLSA